MQPQTLGVIGLDSLGGSVAWQAARAGVPSVLGYSSAPRDAVAAARAGAISELLQDMKRLVRRSDFVVVAASPRTTMAVLKKVAPLLEGADRFVTDVSSVKRPLEALAREQNLLSAFAGSHPLVDVHEGGFAAARPDLYNGKTVYVTAQEGGERAAREVADFWHRVLDAHPVTLDAWTHDSMIAWTSHLPRATAAALAATLQAHGPKGVTYGSESRSATALAAHRSADLAEILLLNREPIADALKTMDRTLHELGAALAANDEQRVRAWLEAAGRWRSRLGS